MDSDRYRYTWTIIASKFQNIWLYMVIEAGLRAIRGILYQIISEGSSTVYSWCLAHRKNRPMQMKMQWDYLRLPDQSDLFSVREVLLLKTRLIVRGKAGLSRSQGARESHDLLPNLENGTPC
jgi:hypothetical protein